MKQPQKPSHYWKNVVKKAALKYLKQFEQENEGISYDEIPNGSSDQIYCQGNYVLTYNTSLEYIGLYKIIRGEE